MPHPQDSKMLHPKDASLRDLLFHFITFRSEWVFSDTPDEREEAEAKMQDIAGELNRRFYITQQHNQVLIEVLDRLIDYFVTGYPGGADEHEVANDLEHLKEKLEGWQP
jgi:hypothetical protein